MCVPQPQGGVNFIRTFKKQAEDQAVNLPPNLDELVQNATYVQSPDNLVWQYFYNLKGTQLTTLCVRALCVSKGGEEGICNRFAETEVQKYIEKS